MFYEILLTPDLVLRADGLCYKIALSAGQPPFRGPTAPVFVNNQFQADAFVVNHLRELCVPSEVQ